MTYTAEQYAEAVWEYVARTTNPGTAPDPDGSYLDSINRAVWEAASRTITGGGGTNLTATALRAGSTTGQPSIGQVHGLTATALRSGATVGTPTAAQANVLAATGLASAATTARPSIGQVHALTAMALRSGSTTGTPTCGIVTIVYDFLATALASGATVGQPALGQRHALTATALRSSPTTGTPTAYVGLGLTATPIAAASLVGAPALDIVRPTSFAVRNLYATSYATALVDGAIQSTATLRSGYIVTSTATYQSPIPRP